MIPVSRTRSASSTCGAARRPTALEVLSEAVGAHSVWSPGFGSSLFHVAQAFEASGDREGARRTAEVALAMAGQPEAILGRGRARRARTSKPAPKPAPAPEPQTSQSERETATRTGTRHRFGRRSAAGARRLPKPNTAAPPDTAASEPTAAAPAPESEPTKP